MSFTTGQATISKSMNGLATFDTGGGVTIEGDSITTVGLEATNIECNTLVVDSSATFNNNLPTSTVATSNDLNQLINRTIGNQYYAKLNGANTINANNAFNGNNVYNSSYNEFLGILPSTDQTTVSSIYDLINLAIANQYFPRLAQPNVFSNINSYNTFLPTSTLTTTTNNNQFITKAIADNLYQASGSSVQLSGNNNFTGQNTYNTNLPSSSLTITTNNNQFITKQIADNLYQASGGGFVQLSGNNNFSGQNTYNTNLPSSSLTTTTNNNQFVTKAIADTLYQAVGGGFVQLNTNNAFSGQNTYNNFLPTSSLTTSNNTAQFLNRVLANQYYPQLSQQNTFALQQTFTALPICTTTANNLQPTGLTNWQTMNTAINSGITNLLASINTWTGNNTFNENVTLAKPLNLNYATAPVFGVQSVGWYDISTGLTRTGLPLANTYYDTVTYPSINQFGVWQVEYTVGITSVANRLYTQGIGLSATVPIASSIVMYSINATVASGGYLCKTTCIFQNQTKPFSIFGLLRANGTSNVIASSNLQITRIG